MEGELGREVRASSYRKLSAAEKENLQLDVRPAGRVLKVSSEIFKLKDVNVSELRQAHMRFQVFLSQQDQTREPFQLRKKCSGSAGEDFSTWGKMQLSELNAEEEKLSADLAEEAAASTAGQSSVGSLQGVEAKGSGGCDEHGQERNEHDYPSQDVEQSSATASLPAEQPK